MKILKLTIFNTFTLTEKLEMPCIPPNIPIFPVKCPVTAPAEWVCVGGVSSCIAERRAVWVFQQRLTTPLFPKHRSERYHGLPVDEHTPSHISAVLSLQQVDQVDVLWQRERRSLQRKRPGNVSYPLARDFVESRIDTPRQAFRRYHPIHAATHASWKRRDSSVYFVLVLTSNRDALCEP